jgi:hypothetical protein
VETGALFTSVARDPRRGWVDLALLASSTVGPSRGPFFCRSNSVRPGLSGGRRKGQLVNWPRNPRSPGEVIRREGLQRLSDAHRRVVEWLALSTADRHRRLYDEVRL